MKPSTRAYLNHMKDGLKQTVHGLAFVSPLVGAFTGFAVNFMGHWGSAALMGLWMGPIVAAGAVALLAVAEYGPKDALKKFGDLTAVNGVSLSIPRGEFFAILGPNAAGKTTTIKILTGLIRPTSGSASVAGFDVQQHPLEARKSMAYVPDFPFLYDNALFH